MAGNDVAAAAATVGPLTLAFCKYDDCCATEADVGAVIGADVEAGADVDAGVRFSHSWRL